MIERHLSAESLNAVLNDPSVRPWVANGSEVLDVSRQVADRNNVLLMGEHGGCMFFRLLPGMYEVHTQVKRAGRGEWTDHLTAACSHWMFTRTDAYEIVTRVPDGHVAARAATQRSAMTHEFTRSNECTFRDRQVDIHIYSGRIQDWVQTAPHLVELGRRFHDRLHEEAARLGVADPAHDDDENHNRYVGAAYEMIRWGQVAKGVNFYNRWALLARHPLICLLSRDPVAIRIDHGMIVMVRGDCMEVTLP